MSKIINHNVEFNPKSSKVLFVSYFFILVCFVSLFLQNQTSFLSFNKSYSQKKAFLIEVKKAKQPAQFHYAEFPKVESVITINLLEESEDDNKQKVSQDLSDIIYKKFSKNEHNYSSVLRSRFLQFALSIHKRSDIPFFILHHSWKAHLS